MQDKFAPIERMYEVLSKHDVMVSDDEKLHLDHMRDAWGTFLVMMDKEEKKLNKTRETMGNDLERELNQYNSQVRDTADDFNAKGPTFYAPMPGQGSPDLDGAKAFIEELRERLASNRGQAERMKKGLDLFGLPHPDSKETEETEAKLRLLDKVWDLMDQWLSKWEEWKSTQFNTLNVQELDTQAVMFQKMIQNLNRSCRKWKVWTSLQEHIKRFRGIMPLISDLRSPAMRERHWDRLSAQIDHPEDEPIDPNGDGFTLEKMFGLGLNHHKQIIASLAAVANREMTIEKSLANIKLCWAEQPIELDKHKNRFWKVKGSSVMDLNDVLEEHQLKLASHKNSPFFITFSEDINFWVRRLNDLVPLVLGFINTSVLIPIKHSLICF